MLKTLIILSILHGLVVNALAGTLSGVTATLGLVDNTFSYGDVSIHNGITYPYVEAAIGTYASWGQVDILSDTNDGTTGVDVVLEITWTKSYPSETPPTHARVTYQLGTEGYTNASVSGGGCYTENLANLVIPQTVDRTVTANLSSAGTLSQTLTLQWTSDREALVPLTATGNPNVYTGTLLLDDVGTIALTSESYGVYGSYHEASGGASGRITYKTISAQEAYLP